MARFSWEMESKSLDEYTNIDHKKAYCSSMNLEWNYQLWKKKKSFMKEISDWNA